MLVCEYCKNSFSNKGNLTRHQKGSVYCLEIQKKTKVEYKCQYCSYITRDQNLFTVHQGSCQITTIISYQREEKLEKRAERYEDKLESVRKEYEDKIDQIRRENEEKLERINRERIEERIMHEKTITTLANKLAKAGKNINSHNKIIIQPITNEYLIQMSDLLGPDDIVNQEAAIQYISKILKGMVFVGNKKERVFIYGKDDVIVRDQNLYTLQKNIGVYMTPKVDVVKDQRLKELEVVKDDDIIEYSNLLKDMNIGIGIIKGNEPDKVAKKLVSITNGAKMNQLQIIAADEDTQNTNIISSLTSGVETSTQTEPEYTLTKVIEDIQHEYNHTDMFLPEHLTPFLFRILKKYFKSMKEFNMIFHNGKIIETDDVIRSILISLKPNFEKLIKVIDSNRKIFKHVRKSREVDESLGIKTAIIGWSVSDRSTVNHEITNDLRKMFELNNLT